MINNLLASALALVAVHSTQATSLETCFHNCQANGALVNLTSQFEGYSPFTYPDVGGKPTIGYGHLITSKDHIAEPLLPVDAAELLKADLATPSAAVNKFVQRPLCQNQFNALVSFTYNVGSGSLKKSTLLKKVNANADNDVPPQFLRYTNANGKEIPGLVVRRRTEANLYATQLGTK